MTLKLFDLLASPVFAFNSGRRVVYCNDACAAFFNLPRQKIVSQTPCFELFTFSDQELFVMPFGTKGKNAPSKYREVSYKTKGGLEGLVRIAIAPIESDTEGETLWACYLQDMSLEASLHSKYKLELQKKEEFIVQLQQAQDQLLQASKMATIGEFTASISHELNSPLAVLGNCIAELTELARKEPMDRAKLDKYLGMCERGTKKILSLSQHLKSFSHSPLSEANLIQTQVNGLVDSSIQFTRHLKGFEKIKVVNLVSDASLSILLDPGLTEQILVNLIKNAMEALNEHGAHGAQDPAIEIRASRDEEKEKVVISVKDNGPGIPPDVRKKLFTPFYSTKGVGKGTGLGLSLCQTMAIKQGGSLMLAPPGDFGAEFFLTFPTLGANEREMRKVEVELTGKNVLIVDDEQLICEYLSKYFSTTGCKIRIANDGESALKIVSENKFDLVVTDIVMGRLDGFDLARRIREQAPDTCIICISGSVALTSERWDQALFEGFLAKPFTMYGLRQVVIESYKRKRGLSG